MKPNDVQELLQLAPYLDLKKLIELAYTVGLRDGIKETKETFERAFDHV